MLYVYRKYHIIEHVYKTLNNLALPIEPNFFERQNNDYNLRDDYKLKQPNFKTTTYGYRSISCQGSILWNKLPKNVKNVADFPKFKTSIRKCSMLSVCECGCCIICFKDNIWIKSKLSYDADHNHPLSELDWCLDFSSST